MADSTPDALASFMDITGADSDRATQFLEVTNWNLDEAVNLFMESGGDSSFAATQTSSMDNAPPAPNAPSGSPAPQLFDDDGIRAPDPSRRQQLVGGDFDMMPMPMRRFHAQDRDFAAESIAQLSRVANDSAAMQGQDGSNSRSDGPNAFSGLFEPPVDIMHQGTYNEARSHARELNRWLLVNLQDDIVFASHMLNRDTWSNDVVQNIVASDFVFWQSYFSSDHGRKFCTLYQVERDTLPVIMIIDPKTGEVRQKWNGFIDVQDMMEKLTDFVCMNPMSTDESDVLPSDSPMHGADDAQETQAAGTEQEQLNAAIAASLDPSGGNRLGSNDESKEEKKTETVALTLPPEPAAGPDVTSVRIRAPDGSRLTRRFNKTDPVSALWAFVQQEVEEARSRSFELRSAFPPQPVSFSDTETIADKQLENASLMLQWA